MDLQQEQIARTLGEGHRVIHGAAGSGQTMILIHRAQHLAVAARADRPVLVLCFNRSLADRIAAQLHERGVDERVQVRTFHGWCKDVVDSYQLDVPWVPDKQAQFHQMVSCVERSLKTGFVPGGQYCALLVDGDLVVQVLEEVVLHDAAPIQRAAEFGVDRVPRPVDLLAQPAVERAQVFAEVLAAAALGHAEACRRAFAVAVRPLALAAPRTHERAGGGAPVAGLLYQHFAHVRTHLSLLLGKKRRIVRLASSGSKESLLFRFRVVHRCPAPDYSSPPRWHP